MEVEGSERNEKLGKTNQCVSFIPCTSRFRWFGHANSILPADKRETDLEEESTANVEEEKQKQLGGWKTFPFIIGNEVCSTAASTNLSGNMIVYLTTQFNIKNIQATNIINISSAGSQLAPLVGAFLADSYLGLFWIISIGSVVSFIATVLITLTAIISSLRPPECNTEVGSAGTCHGPSSAQYGFLYFYFALTILSNGAISFNSTAFGADQFNKETAEGMKNIQTFFNWYYFGLYSSFILAMTVVVYIQANVSWAWGFGICAVVTGISLLLFFAGTRWYNRISPEGSPFKRLAQVVVACVRKRNLQLPSNAEDYYYGNTLDSTRLPLTQKL
ncbi:hypothetical protein KI387_038679, partial [Taxus chinensis]